MTPDQVIAALAVLAAVGGLLAIWTVLRALARLMERPKWSQTKSD